MENGPAALSVEMVHGGDGALRSPGAGSGPK